MHFPISARVSVVPGLVALPAGGSGACEVCIATIFPIEEYEGEPARSTFASKRLIRDLLLKATMNGNGDDLYDASALGLPTGFGAASKQIPKKDKSKQTDLAAFDGTKRETLNEDTQLDVRSIAVELAAQAENCY